jgi:hypothetical protein
MAFVSAYIALAILVVQAYCIPAATNNRRQATIPAFVNTYGKPS